MNNFKLLNDKTLLEIKLGREIITCNFKINADDQTLNHKNLDKKDWLYYKTNAI